MILLNYIISKQLVCVLSIFSIPPGSRKTGSENDIMMPFALFTGHSSIDLLYHGMHCQGLVYIYATQRQIRVSGPCI